MPEPPFTDPDHPVGLCLFDGHHLRIGWGGPGNIVIADLDHFTDHDSIARLTDALAARIDLPAMTAEKLRFLSDILERRLDNTGKNDQRR